LGSVKKPVPRSPNALNRAWYLTPADGRARVDIDSDNHRLRVLDVVPFEEEDESPFGGLLQVKAA
jgi:hypothetical protein